MGPGPINDRPILYVIKLIPAAVCTLGEKRITSQGSKSQRERGP